MEELRDEDLVYHAKMAYTAERFTEMLGFMLSYASKVQVLETEQRKMLNDAYKATVSERRLSYRRITQSLLKERSKEIPKLRNIELVELYKTKIREEINNLNIDIINILDTTLIPKALSSMDRLFYLEMKARVTKSMANTAEEGSQIYEELKLATKLRYEEAITYGEESTYARNPILFDMTARYAYFTYEVLNLNLEGYNIGKELFDGLIENIENIPDEDYKDITLTCSLLRDNLTLWSSDNPHFNTKATTNQQQFYNQYMHQQILYIVFKRFDYIQQTIQYILQQINSC